MVYIARVILLICANGTPKKVHRKNTTIPITTLFRHLRYARPPFINFLSSFVRLSVFTIPYLFILSIHLINPLPLTVFISNFGFLNFTLSECMLIHATTFLLYHCQTDFHMLILIGIRFSPIIRYKLTHFNISIPHLLQNLKLFFYYKTNLLLAPIHNNLKIFCMKTMYIIFIRYKFIFFFCCF